MPMETTDVRSSPHEQIVHCVEVLGRSKDRKKVFEAIHKGKKRIKTADEIAEITKLKKMRVLQEAKKLVNNRIVKQTKKNGKTAYEKDGFYSQHKRRILRLVEDKRALAEVPTKWSPKTHIEIVSIPVPKRVFDVRQLTIDDIDSFHKVKEVRLAPKMKNIPILEEAFKEGLQHVLEELGEFKDWGGESDDLFSNRLILEGRRVAVAFGLKGRGTKGKLTPRKMGKQGDQIQRLFRTPAELFMVQYWGQISESVLEQMKALAIMKSVLEGKRIYYGIIDGQDTLRIILAYREHFSQSIID